MHVTKIVCPVDHVKMTFPFPEQDLQPVIENIVNNNSLPATDESFPVGTITADGRLDMCKQQLGVFGVNYGRGRQRLKKIFFNKLVNEYLFSIRTGYKKLYQ